MCKKTDICHLNKEVWIPAIEQTIQEWIDFSKSIFCKKYEDRMSALAKAEELLDLLKLVKTDSLTYEQFDTLRFYVW